LRAVTFLARRFVAGDTPADAIAVGRALASRSICATFDLLGEDVDDEAAARRSAAACSELLRQIPAEVDRNVSIKLSMMGLHLSRDLALELASAIVAAARDVGGFVRIDMEGSRDTQATLDVFHALRRDFDCVGIVLQAYLHRTEDDVREAIGRGDRVRLCKGAYKESAPIALTDPGEIQARYRRLARTLLEGGNFPALATHDESLIEDARTFAHEKGIDGSRFEFQMLYGLRRGRWDEMVRGGNRLRIYVPFGTHWLPYFYRRLRERKENVIFVLRHLLGR
jgi:proline dehydrogenase